MDLLTPRENTLDEEGSKEDESLKSWIPKEKYHHYIWMDTWQQSVDFRIKCFG